MHPAWMCMYADMPCVCLHQHAHPHAWPTCPSVSLWSLDLCVYPSCVSMCIPSAVLHQVLHPIPPSHADGAHPLSACWCGSMRCPCQPLRCPCGLAVMPGGMRLWPVSRPAQAAVQWSGWRRSIHCSNSTHQDLPVGQLPCSFLSVASAVILYLKK